MQSDSEQRKRPFQSLLTTPTIVAVNSNHPEIGKVEEIQGSNNNNNGNHNNNNHNNNEKKLVQPLDGLSSEGGELITENTKHKGSNCNHDTMTKKAKKENQRQRKNRKDTNPSSPSHTTNNEEVIMGDDASSDTSKLSKVIPTLPTIYKLRLEAIFYPKFENEGQTDQSIRREMIHRVAMAEKVEEAQVPTSSSSTTTTTTTTTTPPVAPEQQSNTAAAGYLEVSIKHSGSLLLWSGGERYYSKNSLDNRFTAVGEILLRQHFARAFPDDWNRYAECSHYIEHNRLTLSFEVVTSFLGDHGDRPQRDFLILTAVADRGRHCFLPTPDVIALAHRFRLPHNDVWVYSTAESVRALFHFYDTHREMAMASTVLEALTKQAEVYVPSMYPHTIFQGEIMEGIVTRYVACDRQDRITLLERMKQFAMMAKDIQQNLVPPDRPSFPEWSNHNSLKDTLPMILSARLRDIHEKFLYPPGSLPQTNSNDDPNGAADHDRHSNNNNNDNMTTSNNNKSGNENKGSNNIDETQSDAAVFNNNCGNVVTSSNKQSGEQTNSNNPSKDETQSNTGAFKTFDMHLKHILKISGCRRTVERLSGSKNPDMAVATQTLVEPENDKETAQIAKLLQTLDQLSDRIQYGIVRESCGDTERWLCTIHVFFDKTFRKFRKAISLQKDAMELYRGFVFELVVDPDSTEDTVSRTNHIVEDSRTRDATVEEPLMLKMKFLPYMIRTFCFRNGLPIAKSGPEAFVKYCREMLIKWNISLDGRQKWLPILEAWGVYAHKCLSGDTPNEQLPTLSGETYLDHYDYFMKKYEEGSLPKLSSANCLVSGFQGLVIVVAPTIGLAGTVSEFIATQMKAPGRVIHDIEAVTDAFMEGTLSPGCGKVLSLAPEQGNRHVRRLLKNFKGKITLVLFHISELAQSDDKMYQGLAKAWRSIDNGNTFELAYESLFPIKDGEPIPDETFRTMLTSMNETHSDNSEASLTNAHDIIVFFPGIPGCGKSCIVTSESDVKKELSKLPDDQRVDLKVLEGDRMSKKYWNYVIESSQKTIPSLILADKNAPAKSWDMVASVCKDAKAWGLCVVPDRGALCTTEVLDIADLSGKKSKKKHVYPFSLAYLAVCLARVLDRPPRTHPGKLDVETKRACLIVIFFYGLYRQVTADEFHETMSRIFARAEAVLMPTKIEVPFFKLPEQTELPVDIKSVLIEALEIQFYCQIEKIDTLKSNSVALDDLEHRLRTVIKKHRNTLLAMTVDEEHTRREFISQLVAASGSVYSSDGIMDLAHSNFIKLAAIDVNRKDIHNILLQMYQQGKAARFFTTTGSFDPGSPINDEAIFAAKPHVTLAHCSCASQSDLRTTFQDAIGSTVKLLVTAFWWGEEVAALEVVVDVKTENGLALCPSINEFVHITVWTMKGVSGVKSNELPELCLRGEAHRVELDEPVTLHGIINFWT